LVVLSIACGSSHVSSDRTTSPNASSARTASSVRQESPIPTYSPVPSLPPVARVPFPPCKLPYLQGGQSASLGALQGGFVQGSSGGWAADSAGGITKSGDFYVTDAKPTLRGSAFSGDDSGTYDLALRRWLPVKRAQVRSDRLAYAYAEPFKAQPSDSLNDAARIHVVSLADGSDRVIYSGAPRVVVAYEGRSVYITAVRYYGGEGGSGLWRLDQATGTCTQSTNVQKGWIEAVDKGIAWTDGATITPR